MNICIQYKCLYIWARCHPTPPEMKHTSFSQEKLRESKSSGRFSLCVCVCLCCVCACVCVWILSGLLFFYYFLSSF